MEEQIYKLGLHGTYSYKTGPTEFFITRVAGGWLYQIYRLDNNALSCTFVPFDNEFQNKL